MASIAEIVFYIINSLKMYLCICDTCVHQCTSIKLYQLLLITSDID